MRFAAVAEVSGRVAETSRRLEKIALLADLLGRLDPHEIEIAAAWLAGETRQGKTGAGYAKIRKAMTAPASEPSLEIREVDDSITAFANTQGAGSEQKKATILRELYERATAAEQRFLTGILGGELRQGAMEGVLLDAIAKAGRVDASKVRRAVMMAGNTGVVARDLLSQGPGALDRYQIQLMRPVQPMLASPAGDPAAAIETLGPASLEYKIDGARVQVHKQGDEVLVFTRNLNDVTSRVPEVIDAVRAIPARELILDGEVISLLEDGRPQPFQITMRRFGRKLDNDVRAALPLTPFWFDLVYLDGASLLDEPQARRFQALKDLSPHVIPHKLNADAKTAEAFFEEALARGHEGLMAKAPESGYAAGSRGESWLKIKRAKTLDLVILAAEWGNGRRRGWLSNLHLGARDLATGGFAMLGKTFKGLTDEMLAWQTEQLLRIEVARDAYTVYVEPRIVVEIAFSDVQISPRYESGLALRFARVKRYRTDKSADDADTFQTVQSLA
jgi:DNA ligase-1